MKFSTIEPRLADETSANSSLECDERSSEVGTPDDRPKTSALNTVITTGAAVATILTVYLLRLDHAAGLFKDYGWYVVLAKSLATGQGYKLINLTDHGQYFYPPVFPFLLSLLYRILPEFPRNVPLLKSL